MKRTYTIGELAEVAGVSTKTLRVYEKKGLLLPERNAENQYRMYTEKAVRKLEQIQLMKYLGFSLEQIEVFLSGNEGRGRDDMLRTQKRLLERKREQLDSVIACVEKALLECGETDSDSEGFLHSLGGIIKNRKADELAIRLGQHSDEPRGWSEFVYKQAGIQNGMKVLDAGVGYGNLWRYNLERLPEALRVLCVDKHNTHAEEFFEFVKKKEEQGVVEGSIFSFAWDDLELMEISEKFHCIFFNHVASFIQDRVKLYRKFRESLTAGGRFFCTWGGPLLYENLMPLLNGFLENMTPFETKKKKQEMTLTGYERELRTVFSTVARNEYLTVLRFATAEEYMDYILQVCKSVEEELEQRRSEFLVYLKGMQNSEGQYELVRDTYLYVCKEEV